MPFGDEMREYSDEARLDKFYRKIVVQGWYAAAKNKGKPEANICPDDLKTSDERAAWKLGYERWQKDITEMNILDEKIKKERKNKNE